MRCAITTHSAIDRSKAEAVQVDDPPPIVRDPKDDVFVATALVLLGLNEPMVVTLSEAKSLGTMGGMLRSAQHDKPLGYFRRAVLES